MARPQSERHKIIHVSEDARQDMFETTKREFIRDNGDRDAERTQRSEVYKRYQHREHGLWGDMKRHTGELLLLHASRWIRHGI